MLCCVVLLNQANKISAVDMIWGCDLNRNTQ